MTRHEYDEELQIRTGKKYKDIHELFAAMEAGEEDEEEQYWLDWYGHDYGRR